MKKLLVLAILSIGFLGGCKEVMEDKEIKGILTTDKSAFGNKFLEFNDKESNLTRFIPEGPKIVQINKKGLNKIEIKLMEERRVQLGRIVLDNDAYSGDANNFVIKSRAMNQDWDLVGSTKTVPLMKETLPTRNSKICQLSNCTGDKCSGLKGYVWFVNESRNDIEIKFLVPDTDKVWGHFKAKGSRIVTASVVKSKECRPRKVIINEDKELFQ